MRSCFVVHHTDHTETSLQVFYDTASTTCSSESDAARTSRLSRSRSLESSRAHLPLRFVVGSFKGTPAGLGLQDSFLNAIS